MDRQACRKATRSSVSSVWSLGIGPVDMPTFSNTGWNRALLSIEEKLDRLAGNKPGEDEGTFA